MTITLTVTAILAGPLTPTPAAETGGVDASFTAKVLAEFDRWDEARQGEITRQDTERLTLNPSVKGSTAAAVACLEWAKRKFQEQSPRFTKDFFVQCAQAVRDGQKVSPDFDQQYEHYLLKLARSSRNLFENGGPARDAMHQGKTGDCFFISVVGSLVTLDRTRIAKMIIEDGSGYEVRFAKMKTHIEPLTDTEICLSAYTVNNGLWLPLLEKAYGTLKLQQEHVLAGTEEPTDALMGGRVAPIIVLFTGHKVKTMHFSARNENDATTYSDLRDVLTRLVGSGHVATAGTGDRSPKVGNLEPRHAYAVLAYDPQADTLTLWNPWGEDYTTNGPAGPQNGYPTKKGVFVIPLQDFVHTFQHISVETDSVG